MSAPWEGGGARGPLRRTLARAGTGALGRKLFARLLAGHVGIFMLHRFADAELGVAGHDPGILRSGLAMLRAHRVPLLPLRAVVERLRAGEPASGVAFTVDDGYADFHRTGAPLFREFDCPVTLFVTTGFLDGRLWFWWDKLSWAFRHTQRTSVRLAVGTLPLPCGDPGARMRAATTAAEGIKRLPLQDRDGALGGLLGQLEVELPERAPQAFAPMSWDEARRDVRAGVDLGPHSVTHPSLGVGDERLLGPEISGSWTRLKEEVHDPVPVFCYPYGTRADVSAAAAGAVRSAGLAGAVTALPGYAVTAGRRRSDPYQVPRFSWWDDLLAVRQVAFGMERLKEILRPVRGGGA